MEVIPHGRCGSAHPAAGRLTSHATRSAAAIAVRSPFPAASASRHTKRPHTHDPMELPVGSHLPHTHDVARRIPVALLGDCAIVSPSPVPAYHRLAEQIRRLIEQGHLRPADQMPPESELATHFGVCRPTVRQALKELTDQHLIERIWGRGTFIAHLPASATTGPKTTPA